MDAVDPGIGQPILFGEAGPAAILEPQQAAAARSDPERGAAGSVFRGEEPHDQPVGDFGILPVGVPLAVLETGQASPQKPHPEGLGMARFTQGEGHVVRQAVLGAEGKPGAAHHADQAPEGARPDRSHAIGGGGDVQAADHIVGKALSAIHQGPRTLFADDKPLFRGEPEAALAFRVPGFQDPVHDRAGQSLVPGKVLPRLAVPAGQSLAGPGPHHALSGFVHAVQNTPHGAVRQAVRLGEPSPLAILQSSQAFFGGHPKHAWATGIRALVQTEHPGSQQAGLFRDRLPASFVEAGQTCGGAGEQGAVPALQQGQHPRVGQALGCVVGFPLAVLQSADASHVPAEPEASIRCLDHGPDPPGGMKVRQADRAPGAPVVEGCAVLRAYPEIAFAVHQKPLDGVLGQTVPVREDPHRGPTRRGHIFRTGAGSRPGRQQRHRSQEEQKAGNGQQAHRLSLSKAGVATRACGAFQPRGLGVRNKRLTRVRISLASARARDGSRT